MQRNHPAQPDADNINIHENKKHNDCSVKHKWKVAPTSQNQYASDGSTFVWIFYQTSKLSPQDEVFENFLINAPKLLVSVGPMLLVPVSRGFVASISFSSKIFWRHQEQFSFFLLALVFSWVESSCPPSDDLGYTHDTSTKVRRTELGMIFPPKYEDLRWVIIDRVPIWLEKVTSSSKWVGEPD